MKCVFYLNKSATAGAVLCVKTKRNPINENTIIVTAISANSCKPISPLDKITLLLPLTLVRKIHKILRVVVHSLLHYSLDIACCGIRLSSVPLESVSAMRLRLNLHTVHSRFRQTLQLLILNLSYFYSFYKFGTITE